ncbi:3-beta-hydroxycholanate 3-dehydrogenase (NADP(+)) [Zhongshania aliphaticivorans]|uniref:3-beta-hydroxycholanate 3-dehydrogenase (NADP(+)) n=1 Tax=Zhongshania aliphaticivorans TaxID=1470434 RepID=A0A5S9N612_9GAMM|nr:SDR family NAD(P)-dependent oxidoreductase [Zhongshania aliphaticivorans]CAA0080843.1 3-beta-hydroxycholanate 3-dehydrogenase (NADP(+)) [Zhongshania aliphaticivorans]CAA0085315.1 3-beta-hydroxycholanate 3-dehydrogenase (NADP(+)) [Zhongshania aliphaticivorans]
MFLGSNCIALVTGATRGAGKGIALALADAGATVYITGRSQVEGDSALPGTLDATAKDINQRGGIGIPLICDHGNDDEVASVFQRIERDHGKLDILVNNALAVPDGLTLPGPFWQKPLKLQDILNVGMRSSYVAAYYAAPLLIKHGGLLVNTSSPGGRSYMHGPAYGAGKAAIDKMAHDMAVDFAPFEVAVVSLWMGLLKTERTQAVFDADPELYGEMMAMAESPEFTGRVISALAADKERMARSGKIWFAAELGAEYGLTDIDGRLPPSPRLMFGDETQFSDVVVQ